MEFKSLILGILFSLGVFAFKSGLGVSYVFMREMKTRTRAVILLAGIGGYALVFFASYRLMQHLDVLKYFEWIQTVLKSGMVIHGILAAFMLFYGIRMLKRSRHDNTRASGWLLLAIPCPVCSTVIFFSVAFLLAYFPESGAIAVAAAYIGYLLILILTLVLMKIGSTRSQSSPESILGAAMLLMAVYFLISVVVMPQFGDLDKVYRLAMYKAQTPKIFSQHVWILASIALSAFSLGFLTASNKIRRACN